MATLGCFIHLVATIRHEVAGDLRIGKLLVDAARLGFYLHKHDPSMEVTKSRPL